MQWFKQSTAATISIGPCLDSTGAEYTGLVIGDLTLTKNGTSAAMAASATLTATSNGFYDLVTTTGNMDTLGRLRIRCNKSTYQIPPIEGMVLTATTFDALITNAAGGANGLLLSKASNIVDANVISVGPTGANTAQTARDLGTSVLLSVGTGTGQVNASGGKVPATIAAGDYSGNTPQTGDNYVYLTTNLGALGANLTAVTALVWNALTSGMTTTGSIAKRIIDYLTGDIFAIVNSGSYGNSALLTAIQNVQNGTFISTTIPQVLERPDSSSTPVSISIVICDETGSPKNLDSGNPTITLVNDAGTDLSSRLGAWTNPSTGKYMIVYTNTSTDTIEGLHWDITGTVNSKSRRYVAYMQVVDTTAVSFTSTDRTNLGTILTRTDVATSTRLATTGYTAPDNANIGVAATQATEANTKAGAIQTKTDQLTFTTPNKVDATATTSVDTNAIAVAVRDINNTSPAANSLGAAVNAGVSSGGGSGAYTATITVNDGTNPIQNALVTLTINSSVYTALTNSSGVATLTPNEGNGVYGLKLTAGGYQFTGTTFTLSGNTSHTYSMTAFVPTPSNPGLVTGYFYCRDSFQAPLAGVSHTLKFSSPPPGETGSSRPDKTRDPVISAESTGLVEFTDLLPGASYKLIRKSDSIVFTVPDVNFEIESF